MMEFAIGLGSNVGNRFNFLEYAISNLNCIDGTVVTAISNVYESSFVGDGKQSDYLNACCLLNSDSTPLQLLKEVKKIELNAGRAVNSHMLPRELDIDLLLIKNNSYSCKQLQIPHKEMHRRKFVLLPLSEIAGEWIVEGIGSSVQDLLVIIDSDDDVRLQSDLDLKSFIVKQEAE